MKTARQKNTTKIISAIVICVMALLMVALILQFANIITLKNKQKKLQTTYQMTQQQIEDYDELLDFINYNDGQYSSEFLETYAREYLGWGKTDRTYYEQK